MALSSALVACVFDPLDSLYCATKDSPHIHCVDSNTGAKKALLLAHDHPITALATHQTRLFSADDHAHIRVWDTTNNECLKLLSSDPAFPIRSLAATNNVLYAAATDPSLRVFNISQSKQVKLLSASTASSHTDHSSSLPSLVDAVVGPIQRRASNLGLSTLFSNASQSLFGPSSDPVPSVSPPPTIPSTSTTPPSSAPAIRCVATGLFPGQVFTADARGVITEWDVKSGQIVQTFAAAAGGGSGGGSTNSIDSAAESSSQGDVVVDAEQELEQSGLVWIHVDKESGLLFSAAKLEESGCVRVFEIQKEEGERLCFLFFCGSAKSA
ncbi:hypothetical protein HDU98_002287 [Podochytrium sp. JEL0797]|nr:hypothetical protein HDU98_002287 [Podochytrium sp. JEL0797]